MPSAWRWPRPISPREFGDDVVNHRTYVLASDGDLMEGICQEAIALAGHLKLNKLIVLFDDNGISIDGPLSLADSVDQIKRFESCWLGRHASTATIRRRSPPPSQAAQQIRSSPTLIACRTTIGFGAPTKARQIVSPWLAAWAPTRSRARAKSSAGPHAPFEIPADIL